VAELIDACNGGDAAAWQEFLRRFHRIIALTVSRVARRWGDVSPELIDDLAQDTYLKLCDGGGRVLRDFHSDHPDAIFGFLRVVAANVANDYFRRLRAGKRGGAETPKPLEGQQTAIPLEGLGALLSAERAILLEEVDACVRAVAPPETCERDRTIFWLYYRQGLTAKEIFELPSTRLTLKGVESILHRLTQLVRNRLVDSRAQKTEHAQKGSGAGIR
jgi:RNA polymerase sigma-70 factor (ECF subfamily)